MSAIQGSRGERAFVAFWAVFNAVFFLTRFDFLAAVGAATLWGVVQVIGDTFWLNIGPHLSLASLSRLTRLRIRIVEIPKVDP